ncbi:hypothetical protein I203_108128 [Kwoniella mangroviensis CBS 8507]|uniref:hypothetical protein n=1 Tax=Kwoniella mangroviensis CBS 8507 TaxID=1296122 RepID=UPI0030259BB8
MPQDHRYQALSKEVEAEIHEEEVTATKAKKKYFVTKTIIALLCGVLLVPTATWIFGPTDLIEAAETLPDIWKNLSIKEATDIPEWLWQPERGLNLTKSAIAADNDNAIFLIEAYVPPKAAALAYLNGSAEAPPKYAHAVVHYGNTEQIMDYLIGPLPLSSETSMRPLTEIYHRPEIPYNAHGFNPNSTTMGLLLGSTFGPMSDITMDLFGGISKGHANDTLIGSATAPMSYDGSWRKAWVGLKLNVPGHYLFPVDLYAYFDLSGTDPSQWKLLKLVYNGQVFASEAEFRKAWSEGKLNKSKKPLLNDTSEWATRTLDWSLYLGFERDMGLNFWDINFKGERIIYEISPQEAMAQYSGTDPHQATTVFLDRAFGMGASVKELMVGYDCPAEAVYLPATVHTATGSSTRLNAICVFEKDSTKPLSRHTGWLKDEMGAIKGYELTVRSISTVGNYDYLFDLTLQLDGTLELRVSASGYLQGGVWDPSQAPYGHQIRDTSMGSLHDLVINYKVDFDIAGTRNSLMSAMLEMEETTAPWVDEDWGETFKQQRVVRKMIKSENDCKLEYAKNMEGMYIVTNEEEHNSWGNARGYAIHPGASTIHLTNLDCKRTENNVNWAKHSLAVTRRHDNEPYSSSMWNIHLPGKPTVDFYKFFDGESLEQEDLVVWLNLGTHHLPRAEDSPQTLTNVATSSVLLTPYNFHDYDVSMDALNAIILNAPEPGKPWKIDENGAKPSYCMPRKLPDFSYTGLLQFEEDGSPATPAEIIEQRRIAESWHGLHAQI